MWKLRAETRPEEMPEFRDTTMTMRAKLAAMHAEG